MDAKRLEVLEERREELLRALLDGRIGRGEVLVGVRAVPGREEDAVVGGTFPQDGELLPVVAVDGRAGDFKEVKSELGDLLNVLEVVGLPFVFPVGVVDSVFNSD